MRDTFGSSAHDYIVLSVRVVTQIGLADLFLVIVVIVIIIVVAVVVVAQTDHSVQLGLELEISLNRLFGRTGWWGGLLGGGGGSGSGGGGGWQLDQMTELGGERLVGAHDRLEQRRELSDKPGVGGHDVAPGDQIARDRAQEQKVGPDRVEEEGRVGGREPLADEAIARVEVDEAECERGARARHVRVDRLAFPDVRRVRVGRVPEIGRGRVACVEFLNRFVNVKS